MANYPKHSAKFMLKLLAAWTAMGFRRPAVEGIPASKWRCVEQGRYCSARPLRSANNGD